MNTYTTQTNSESQPEEEQNPSYSLQLMQDRQVIVEKFPDTTKEIQLRGLIGWFYTLKKGNKEYTMFVHNDDLRYQVIVVFPEDVVQYSQQNNYLSQDGRIAYDSEIGFSSLEEALDMSAAWVFGLNALPFLTRKNNQE